MKYVFIVNPMSGNKDKSEVIKRISEYCTKNGIDYDIEITKSTGDGTKLALKHRFDKCVIFAVGGDGTLNEVLNGVVHTKNKLGIIPSGSGNDFYKTIITYKDRELPIDIGKVNKRYFINVASIGIDAEVGFKANEFKRNNNNSGNVYTKAIIYTLLNFRKPFIELELKNNIKLGRFMMLSICNGRYYGGEYFISPNSKLDDNLLDLYTISGITKLSVPFLINKLKKGKLDGDRHVEHLTINKVKLKSKILLNCCIDGEEYVGNRFVFKSIKRGVVFYQDRELVKYVLE